MAKRIGKKGAALLGGAVSLPCNGVLGALFLTGGVPFGTVQAFAWFTVFHAAFWLGNGILLPSGIALIADLSAMRGRRTGMKKDGLYASLFSLTTKVSISFALLGAGWALRMIGFDPGATHGTYAPAVIWRLGLAMFLAGPLMTAAALAVIAPLTRLKETRR
jgi:Na+/melibiose symporter-like transporter